MAKKPPPDVTLEQLLAAKEIVIHCGSGGVGKTTTAAAAATEATAWPRRPGSRTTPPAPTRPLPTSNCGLTRSTKSASGAAHLTSAGRTRVREMKERSAVTRSGAGATCPG